MTTGINGHKHAHKGQMKSVMPRGITGLERDKEEVKELLEASK
jgi:hypothetical protein